MAVCRPVRLRFMRLYKELNNSNMEIYRNLTEDEILRLKNQSCLADDWEKIRVSENFSTEFVHHARFQGKLNWVFFRRSLCCREVSASIPAYDT